MMPSAPPAFPRMTRLEREILQTAAIATATAGGVLMLGGAGALIFDYVQNRKGRHGKH